MVQAARVGKVMGLAFAQARGSVYAGSLSWDLEKSKVHGRLNGKGKSKSRPDEMHRQFTFIEYFRLSVVR